MPSQNARVPSAELALRTSRLKRLHSRPNDQGTDMTDPDTSGFDPTKIIYPPKKWKNK
ncbi:Hypothetical predicted protein [Podarcis lilfordi]|uniref:Uncharacterized protein n=1 Tax=Podarcis lilfordi TaxID=74358 RepID=A0AA35KFN5_9SAUR|nr:Hypothetical predicted protein [Podarcis lilfordi]